MKLCKAVLAVLLFVSAPAFSQDDPMTSVPLTAFFDELRSRDSHAPKESSALEKLAQSRLSKCLVCCAERQNACYKERGRGACDGLHNNCVAHCNSEGSTPADWLCWR